MLRESLARVLEGRARVIVLLQDDACDVLPLHRCDIIVTSTRPTAHDPEADLVLRLSEASSEGPPMRADSRVMDVRLLEDVLAAIDRWGGRVVAADPVD